MSIAYSLPDVPGQGQGRGQGKLWDISQDSISHTSQVSGSASFWAFC